MTLLEQLEAAIASWHLNADTLSDIINGPASGAGSEIDFPDGSGGTHPTVAKALADIQIGNVIRYVSQTLTESQKGIARANVGVDLDAILRPEAQTFTETEITQMQTNLDLLNTLRFVSQNLSENQKNQGRLNLGIQLADILQIGIAQALSNGEKLQVQENLGLLNTLKYSSQTLSASEKAVGRANIQAHWQPDVPVHELRVWEEDEEILVTQPQSLRWYGHATHDFQLNKIFSSIYSAPQGDVGGGSGENGDYPVLNVYLRAFGTLGEDDNVLRETYVGGFSYDGANYIKRNVTVDFPIEYGNKLWVRTSGDSGFYGLDVKLYDLHE